ncbi:MAG: ABC transporter permease [FCB group bacterium]|nr:ABC transporter permease [FCB group bacterium]
MIRFLIRGLLRDRQRSLFPVMIVALGVWITVFLQAYMNGVFTDMVDYNARFSSGHVKIMTRAYAENAEQNPNDLALIGVDTLLRQLRSDYPDMNWVRRIHFGGLLDIPDENGETRTQGVVFGLGVDLLHPESKELATLNINKALVRGRLPERPGEILISEVLSQKLDVNPGETATLLGSTMYGSLSVYNFIVAGTVRFGVTAMDRGAIIADIGDVQAALNMEDAAGEILGYFPDRVYNDDRAREISENFNQRYSDEADEFSPIMGSLKDVSNLGEYLDMATNMSTMIVSIFVIIMSLVLWNMGLLGGLRRYGEVGIRLAIGEKKGHIYRSMIVESVAIGLIGSVIGTGLGLGSAYWMQIHGLDISSLLKNVNMMIPTVFRASISAQTWVIGFIPGFLATVLGAALSGVGIYRRQTAQLFKELEV